MTRIVCSAVNLLDAQGNVQIQLVGVRHWDEAMLAQYKVFVKSIGASQGAPAYSDDIQGFLTNEGIFVDRYVAFDIAKQSQQLLPEIRIRYDSKEQPMLYSENLY